MLVNVFPLLSAPGGGRVKSLKSFLGKLSMTATALWLLSFPFVFVVVLFDFAPEKHSKREEQHH